MNPILVQMSDPTWTMQAVHFACAIARSNQSDVVLLRMIPVTHPEYLGTSFGYQDTTYQERRQINDYAATAEDYQVELSVESMQYVTALDAVADAADALDAAIVFAHVPKSFIPYWQKFRIWRLNRRLAASQRQLFTLTHDKDTADRVPYIVDTSAHSPALR